MERGVAVERVVCVSVLFAEMMLALLAETTRTPSVCVRAWWAVCVCVVEHVGVSYVAQC